MNTSYVGEINSARKGQFPPSFYAMAFSAYSRIRYALRQGDLSLGYRMLAEFDRVHRSDKFYWTYRRELPHYFEEAEMAASQMALAA